MEAALLFVVLISIPFFGCLFASMLSSEVSKEEVEQTAKEEEFEE